MDSNLFWLVIFLVVSLLVIAGRLKKGNALQEQAMSKGKITKDSKFDDLGRNSDGQDTILCPLCKEWIILEAKVCKHCGKDVSSLLASRLKEVTSIRAKEAKYLVSPEYLESLNAYKASVKSISTKSNWLLFVGLGFLILGFLFGNTIEKTAEGLGFYMGLAPYVFSIVFMSWSNRFKNKNLAKLTRPLTFDEFLKDAE